MKRIKNTLISFGLVFVIAAGGMSSVAFFLKKTEEKELGKKTEMLHEEIVLSEEETDHLALVLKSLEENNLTKKAVGSGVSIPEGKAWDMLEQAMEEMCLLDINEFLPLADGNGEQWQKCELMADVNNLSLEMYQMRILILDDWYGVELISMLDARSGLLISQNLTFMTQEETVEKIQEEYYDSTYGNYYNLYGNQDDGGEFTIEGKNAVGNKQTWDNGQMDEKLKTDIDNTLIEVGIGYNLKAMLANACNYYSYNTNFDFTLKEESEKYYRQESRDGEYYLEFTQEGTNFHFQLHKFDL